MRRDKRPFVVELKRGQKRPVTSSELGSSRPKPIVRSAYDSVFSGSLAGGGDLRCADQPSETPGKDITRRILESVVESCAAPSPSAEPARLGRKPKAQSEVRLESAPTEKRRRGRPSKQAESTVRKVTVTPELSSAALDQISNISQHQIISTIPGGHMTLVPLFEPAPKRKRGRPRKIKPPKFDWTEWAEGAPEIDAADTVVQQPIPLQTHLPQALPRLSGVTRFDGPKVRAGERWKRRLRFVGGAAARQQA
jgi:hypothetical protein